nr:MAG TPA: hypothetical protein [Caudoviricetes sp.]
MTKTNTTIDFHPEHSEERNDFPFDLPYVIDRTTDRRYVRAEHLYKLIYGVDLDAKENRTKELVREFKEWCNNSIIGSGFTYNEDYSVTLEGASVKPLAYLTLDTKGLCVYFHLPAAWYICSQRCSIGQWKDILTYLSTCEEYSYREDDDDLEDDFYGDDDDPYEDYMHGHEDDEVADDEAVGEEEQKYRALIDAKLDELIDHMDELEDRTAALETKLCNIRISMSE